MTAVRRKAAVEPRPTSKQNLRLWLRLLRTTRGIEAELRERLRLRFDMTLPRFDVLAALDRHPKGLGLTALSRLLIVSNGNVTGLIDRLVKDGLVIRMADERDKRATFVRLTRKGEVSFRRMAGEHAVWIDELLGGIDTTGLDVAMSRMPARELRR